MIATALLNLPPGPDPTFDSLKYAGSMTFEDLALDYSESGVAIISVLGKRQVSHTAVIAGFVRAAFLKYSGLVTEAWSVLFQALATIFFFFSCDLCLGAGWLSLLGSSKSLGP